MLSRKQPGVDVPLPALMCQDLWFQGCQRKASVLKAPVLGWKLAGCRHHRECKPHPHPIPCCCCSLGGGGRGAGLSLLKERVGGEREGERRRREEEGKEGREGRGGREGGERGEGGREETSPAEHTGGRRIGPQGQKRVATGVKQPSRDHRLRPTSRGGVRGASVSGHFPTAGGSISVAGSPDLWGILMETTHPASQPGVATATERAGAGGKTGAGCSGCPGETQGGGERLAARQAPSTPCAAGGSVCLQGGVSEEVSRKGRRSPDPSAKDTCLPWARFLDRQRGSHCLFEGSFWRHRARVHAPPGEERKADVPSGSKRQRAGVGPGERMRHRSQSTRRLSSRTWSRARGLRDWTGHRRWYPAFSHLGRAQARVGPTSCCSLRTFSIAPAAFPHECWSRQWPLSRGRSSSSVTLRHWPNAHGPWVAVLAVGPALPGPQPVILPQAAFLDGERCWESGQPRKGQGTHRCG